MIVKTKVPFTGYRATVYFKNGIGATDDEHLLEWFKSKGYELEDEEAMGELDDTKEKINYAIMSVEELKEYAKKIGKGKGIGVLTTKEQLIRHIEKE